MTDSRRFFLGFFSVVLLAVTICLLTYIALSRAGEISIDDVIFSQQKSENTLYSSGLDQGSYFYKMKLMEVIQPEIVAIGSSRAMQLRRQFFKRSFVNTGGAVKNVAELESITNELVLLKQKPKLAFVFIDPWWLNSHFAGAGGIHPPNIQPDKFSFDFALAAMKTLKNGNWIAKLFTTNNLGIHAIITGEGFGRDGSYHYTNILKGSSNSFKDQAFKNTLERIGKGNRRFEKGDYPDQKLVLRTCFALKKLTSAIDHVVVVTPPFAPVVWKEMAKGGYGYIQAIDSEIKECLGTGEFHTFVSGLAIPNNTDCEFIDGFHGGDITYAKIISVISDRDSTAKEYVDIDYLAGLIKGNSGMAGPITTKLFSINEVDFLKIGCQKELLY